MRYSNKLTVMLLILQYFAAGVQPFCRDPNILPRQVFNADWFLLRPQIDLRPFKGTLSHQHSSCCTVVTSTSHLLPVFTPYFQDGGIVTGHRTQLTFKASYCLIWVRAMQVKQLSLEEVTLWSRRQVLTFVPPRCGCHVSATDRLNDPK